MMSEPESNRAVLITGASSGIGAATVALLARNGFTVYAGVRNDADAARLRESDERVRPLLLDVTDLGVIEAAANAIRDAKIPLVGLVNNAGIALAGPLETVPLDELRRQFDVNVFGAVAVTKAFLPLLREQPSRVVFVGSVSGRSAVPYIAPYSASKFALRAVADALRLELRPCEIGVCLIEPGSVATPIWRKGRAMNEAMLAKLSDTLPAHYRTAIARLNEIVEQENRTGMRVERVADAILRALTDRKPPARIIVGKRAKLGTIIALLPAALHDRFLRAGMKLP